MTDNRDRERTTVVHTERKGSGGMIALVVLILLAALLLFMFRDQIFGGNTPEKIDVEVTMPEGKSS